MLGPFPRSQTIEVATADGTLHTSLSLNSDSLILQDEHTAVGTMDLDKAFGESAFGELRLRAVPGDGTFGNWITLGKLVRRPHITAVHCTAIDTPTCMIEGSDLFLALAFSATESFRVRGTGTERFRRNNLRHANEDLRARNHAVCEAS